MKTLTKSSVWDVQENDIFRMLTAAEKDAELKDNLRHYIDIIRSAFTIEEVNPESKLEIKKYENLGYKVGQVKLDENQKVTWAIKKRPISRVTDLTYENIRHISANKLLEVIERNFGGGWDSLAQSVQDIILSGFDISTTTLPKDRLHKKGGMYEKKLADGFACPPETSCHIKFTPSCSVGASLERYFAAPLAEEKATESSFPQIL